MSHETTMHAAPPSPWPFFLPIGITMVLIGLAILAAPFVIAGLAMLVLATAGWCRDAGREWRAADRGETYAGPQGADRFPVWALGVYAVIAVMAGTITFGGWAVESSAAGYQAAMAPSPPPGGGPGGLALVAKDIRFTTSSISAPAAKAFDLAFDNEDPLPHNVSIYATPTDTTPLFKGEIVTGPTQVTYHVPALEAGTYEFRCDVHPGSMTGTVTVK